MYVKALVFRAFFKYILYAPTLHSKHADIITSLQNSTFPLPVLQIIGEHHCCQISETSRAEVCVGPRARTKWFAVAVNKTVTAAELAWCFAPLCLGQAANSKLYLKIFPEKRFLNIFLVDICIQQFIITSAREVLVSEQCRALAGTELGSRPG